jgi:hypothetical protein
MTWSTIGGARAFLGLPVLLLGLSALSLGACGSSTTYSYVNVAVSVDTSTFSADDLKRVGNCQVLVAGAEKAKSLDLGHACFPGQTQANLGTFQWTTTETQGWLTFEVLFYVFDTIEHPLARGISPQVDIVKGQSVSTSVIVKGLPDTSALPDAGSDAGAGDAQPDSLATDATSG